MFDAINPEFPTADTSINYRSNIVDWASVRSTSQRLETTRLDLENDRIPLICDICFDGIAAGATKYRRGSINSKVIFRDFKIS